MEELLEFLAALFSEGGRFILAVILIAIGTIVLLNHPDIKPLIGGILSLIAGLFLLIRAFRKE